MHVDHVSTWESASSALFILNEPYRYNETEISALEQAGYEVRLVPVNLGPYGGRFDSSADAKPWTTSLLITKKQNLEELESIHHKLSVESETAPAWNAF
jgi:hypothetical protein